jgi:hypothetical protein
LQCGVAYPYTNTYSDAYSYADRDTRSVSDTHNYSDGDANGHADSYPNTNA